VVIIDIGTAGLGSPGRLERAGELKELNENLHLLEMKAWACLLSISTWPWFVDSTCWG